MQRIVLLSLGFIIPLAILNRALRWLDNHVVDFDRPPYWPIGVFEPRWQGAAGLLIAAACAVFFVLAERALRRRGYPLLPVTFCGLLLILGTNLIHGIRDGYVTPISGGEPAIQYYHDAIKLTSATDCLAHYTERQPMFLDHTRTHPPGAVLFFYACRRLIAGVGGSGASTAEPSLIALIITIISTVASACFLHGLLARHIADRAAIGWTVFAFLLLPAVQIYTCASLDALIAATFLGVLCFLARWCENRSCEDRWCENPFSHPLPRESLPANSPSVAGVKPPSVIASMLPLLALVGCLFAASFLTFAACFLPPVMAAYEFAARRSIRRTIIAVITCVAAYAALYVLTGFNYAASLRIASALENPHGFRLLADPVSYLLTRVECVLEILVFLGPFAAWAIYVAQPPSAVSLWHRRSAGVNDPPAVASGPGLAQALPLLAAHRAALLTLLAMFAAGAFHTAETARACLFFYPFLVFPLAAWMMGVGRSPPAIPDTRRLTALIFVQTLLMQVLGGYFW